MDFYELRNNNRKRFNLTITLTIVTALLLSILSVTVLVKDIRASNDVDTGYVASGVTSPSESTDESLAELDPPQVSPRQEDRLEEYKVDVETMRQERQQRRAAMKDFYLYSEKGFNYLVLTVCAVLFILFLFFWLFVANARRPKTIRHKTVQVVKPGPEYLKKEDVTEWYTQDYLESLRSKYDYYGEEDTMEFVKWAYDRIRTSDDFSSESKKKMVLNQLKWGWIPNLWEYDLYVRSYKKCNDHFFVDAFDFVNRKIKELDRELECINDAPGKPQPNISSRPPETWTERNLYPKTASDGMLVGGKETDNEHLECINVPELPQPKISLKPRTGQGICPKTASDDVLVKDTESHFEIIGEKPESPKEIFPEELGLKEWDIY